MAESSRHRKDRASENITVQEVPERVRSTPAGSQKKSGHVGVSQRKCIREHAKEKRGGETGP